MSDHTVLVVDDDPAILEFYQKIFRTEQASDFDILGTESVNRGRRLGCKVFQDARELLAWYGKAALAGEVSPVCIVDMRMPGADGLDTAWGLLEIDPEIEIILCSAYSDKTVAEMRSRLHDSFYYVRKPFAADEFLLLVDSLCVSWERQRALKKSEERHRSLVNAMSEGVIYQTAANRIDGCNPAALALLGKTKDEIVGADLEELGLKFVRQDGTDIGFRDLPSQRTLATGDALSEQVVGLLRGDQAPVWIRLATSPIWDPNRTRPVGVVSTFHDIGGRLELEKDLVRQRRRLEEVVEATRAGTWEWDLGTGAVAVNGRWAEIAGYSLEELRPTTIGTWIALGHPEDLRESQEALDRHFRGESDVYDLECRMRHKDGRWIWVHDRGCVVERDADGKPIRMSGTHTDITRRKELEAELLRSSAELAIAHRRDAELVDKAKEANQARSGFAADMGREIRASATGILGMVERLEETGLDERRHRFVGTIRSSGKELLELVDGIEDLSRIESRKLEIERGGFEPRRLFAEIADTFELAAASKGRKLEVVVDESIPAALEGDHRRIRRILVHLVGSALESAQGGGVRLRADLAGVEGRIHDLRCVVSCTGTRIPTETRDDPFQSFTRADTSTMCRHRGTGLGLAVSRRLAQAMGGSLERGGAAETGSTFEFVVPLRGTPAGTSGGRPSFPAPKTGGGPREGGPVPAGSRLFDCEALSRACGDDAEKVAKVLEGFLTALPVEFDRLRSILRGDRWEAGWFEASSLAKAAHRFGADQLEETLGRIEKAVSNGRRSQALEEFESLAAVFEAFRESVSAHI